MQERRFVNWKYEDQGGPEPDKVPYTPDCIMRRASVTDPKTWGTYMDSQGRYNADPSVAGIGLILHKNGSTITAIDLDDVIDDTGIQEWARALVLTIGSYTELSPSGQGIHVFLDGSKPTGCELSKIKGLGPGGQSGIEVYDNLRYMTITGVPVPGLEELCSRPIEKRQEHLAVLCEEMAALNPTVASKSQAGQSDHDYAAKIIQQLTADVSTIEMMMREIRCRRYLDCLPMAISGQRGHDATFRAACELFRFGLDEEAAWRALMHFNDTRCTPPWSEKELHHKIRQSRRAVVGARAFGDRLDKQNGIGG
jgi:hypothetical protein